MVWPKLRLHFNFSAKVIYIPVALAIFVFEKLHTGCLWRRCGLKQKQEMPWRCVMASPAYGLYEVACRLLVKHTFD